MLLGISALIDPFIVAILPFNLSHMARYLSLGLRKRDAKKSGQCLFLLMK